MELQQRLLRAMAPGEAVLFVGTGAALAATGNDGRASWPGLLSDGLAACLRADFSLPSDWVQRVQAEIASTDIGDVLSAAEKIGSKLGAPRGKRWRNWLRESVGAFECKSEALIRAALDLQVPIVTTNYDTLIEQVGHLEPVTWRDPVRVLRILRGDERGVIHLHGYWRDPTHVILGIGDYARLTRNRQLQAVLHAVLTMRSVVFVGFGEGLRDPNFTALRRWTASCLPPVDSLHFRLARDSEVARLQHEHTGEDKIQVVSYGTDFEDLVAYLRHLRADTSVASSVAPRGEPSESRHSPRIPHRPLCLGRESLLRTLEAAILAPEPEPIPVLGGPAMGKSTVVTTLLHRPAVATRFGARRFFVRCSGAERETAVVAKIADAIGVHGDHHLGEAVFKALAAQPALLVLDNAETPAEHDRQGFADLLGELSSIAGLALVVVIRGATAPLAIKWGEPVYVLPFEPDEAKEAFVRAALGRHRADPRLEDLVEVVECIPFAVTLLGRLAQAAPNLERIWADWHEQRGTLFEAELTLADLTNIGISFELALQAPYIDDACRRLVRFVGALPDGIAEDHLEKLLGPEGLRAAMVLRQAGLAFHEQPRVRIHALLREFVWEKYPPTAAELDRIVAFYTDLASHYGDRLRRHRDGTAIRSFAADLANIETAIRTGLTGPQCAAAVKAALALAQYLGRTGCGSRELVAQAIRQHRRIQCEERAHFLLAYADVLNQFNELDEARTYYRRARGLFRRLGDEQAAAECSKKIGDVERELGNHRAAKRIYRRASKIQERIGDRLGKAASLAGLADVAMFYNQYQEAVSDFHEAYELNAAEGNRVGMAYCQMRMGWLNLEVDDVAQALARFQEAIVYAQEACHALIEASAQQGLGRARLARQEVPLARECFQAALPVFRRLRNVVGMAGCLRGLGEAALAANRSGWQDYLRDAVDLYDEAKFWGDLAAVHDLLAQAESDPQISKRHAVLAEEARERDRQHAAAHREPVRS